MLSRRFRPSRQKSRGRTLLPRKTSAEKCALTLVASRSLKARLASSSKRLERLLTLLVKKSKSYNEAYVRRWTAN